MQKNALQPLALLLIVTIFSVALCLPLSVAQLRAAASSAAAQSAEKVVASRVLYGPRRHQTRQSAVPLIAASSSSVSSVPSVASVPSRSLLERLLDESGIRSEQRHLAEAVLSLLDESCLEKLETFSVRYDRPKDRGLAGRGVILLSGTVPDKEFIGLLLHEGLGHYRDITCMTGSIASGESEFRDGDDAIYNDDPSVSFYRISWKNEKIKKPAALRSDFVTGYSFEGDNFEDLAESVTYFMTQESAFRLRAAKNPVLAEKLAWLEKHMPKQSAFAEGKEWDGKIAWDATKLAFVWSGRQENTNQ